nr:helix-turn-helix domain-containing protein [Streptomyces rhizoryzae]
MRLPWVKRGHSRCWLRLSSLVTAWTEHPEDEHRLISAMLAVLLSGEALHATALLGPLGASRLDPPEAKPGTPPVAEIVAGRAGAVRACHGIDLAAASGVRQCAGPLDTPVVVGGPGDREAAGRARRVASVGTGAFLLARTGLLVASVQRPHGRARFSTQPAAQRPVRKPLRDVQAWATAHLTDDLTVRVRAERAGTSERDVTRVLRAGTGLTPAASVETARTEADRALPETTDTTIDANARPRGFGFGFAETLRRRFQRTLGVTPGPYRHHFSRAGGRSAWARPSR